MCVSEFVVVRADGRDAYRNLRRDIIELVLATDMSKHFEHLQRFKHYLPHLTQYYNSAEVIALLCLYSARGL